jgi:hypothetical protein
MAQPAALAIRLGIFFNSMRRLHYGIADISEHFVCSSELMIAVDTFVKDFVKENGPSPGPIPHNFDGPFLKMLSQLITGEVRSVAILALSELLSGTLIQGTQPSAKYAELFMIRARSLPNESQAMLCHCFITGLDPELRSLCCMDREK